MMPSLENCFCSEKKKKIDNFSETFLQVIFLDFLPGNYVLRETVLILSTSLISWVSFRLLMRLYKMT